LVDVGAQETLERVSAGYVEAYLYFSAPAGRRVAVAVHPAVEEPVTIRGLLVLSSGPGPGLREYSPTDSQVPVEWQLMALTSSE
jgi:hypothetical protein